MVKGIWFKEATPKYSFLAWLAAHNRLSTGDRLLRRNPQAISTCWLCNSAKESMYHLFFECPFSGEVWRGTVRGLISTILPVWWSILIQRLVSGLQDRTATFFSFDISFKLWSMLYGMKETLADWERPLSLMLDSSYFWINWFEIESLPWEGKWVVNMRRPWRCGLEADDVFNFSSLLSI